MLYYIRMLSHCFSSIFANKVRLFLSISGIIFATLLFTLGNIFIDTYYYKEYNKYSNYGDNTITIKNPTKDILREFQSQDYILYKYNEYKVFNYMMTNNENSQIDIAIKMIEVDNGFLNSLIPTYENEMTLYKPELLYGNDIKSNNIKNKDKVCIIDKLTSIILFGKENSIGHTIKIPLLEDIEVAPGEISREIVGYIDYTVIGVISNSDYSKKIYLELKKDNPLEQSNYFFNVYIPKTSPIEPEIMVVFSKEKLSNNSIYKLMENTNSKIYTKSLLYNNLQYEQRNTNLTLQIVLIVLLVLTGLNILNLVFMSIKERVKEIGIKKALGAKDFDILLNFLIESFIISLIGSIIGIFLSIFAAFNICLLLKFTWMPDLMLKIRYYKIILIIIINVASNMLFTLIPAYYASRIKVIDAIRFV